MNANENELDEQVAEILHYRLRWYAGRAMHFRRIGKIEVALQCAICGAEEIRDALRDGLSKAGVDEAFKYFFEQFA